MKFSIGQRVRATDSQRGGIVLNHYRYRVTRYLVRMDETGTVRHIKESKLIRFKKRQMENEILEVQ